MIELDGSHVARVAAEKAEDELWTAYVVEVARERECWLTYAEAFRVWLQLPQPRNAWASRQVDSLSTLHTESQKRLDRAYKAWRAVAFPLNKEPIVHEVVNDGPSPRSAG